MLTAPSSLQATLQTTRKLCRISQLELALRMGLSQRHVSFVESGRAQPSRELLLAWLDVLNVPLALRNVALQQAGFASIDTSCELGDALLTPAREAIGRLLDAHDPMPVRVLDAGWDILQLNRGTRWLVSTLMPWAQPMLQDLQRTASLNLLDAMLHPRNCCAM